jgi:flagellar biosynthesis protein FlhF
MKAKTYKARSIQEALDQIKRDLGPEAVILSTQSVMRRRRLGLRRVQDWEVTATEAVRSPQPAVTSANADTAKIEDKVTIKTPMGLVPSAGSRQQSPRIAPRLQYNDARIEQLLDEIAELKRSVRLIGASLPGRTAESGGVYSELVSQGMEHEIVDELVTRAAQGNPAPTELRRRVRRAIADVLMVDPPAEFVGKARIVSVFVGPTGSGKTTTIAKIAAHAKARYRKRVALISTDMFRVGGYEQIARYGDLLAIPTYARADTDRLHDLVDSLTDRDLVLIDTPGAGPSDVARLGKLESVTGTNEARVHLVLAASTRSEDITTIVRRFHRFSPRRAIVTKLDETEPKGIFVADILRNELPICFLTQGQRVPEDLLTPTAEDLARYLLPVEVVGAAKIPVLTEGQ